ncbi:MAG: DUF3576 domain-containing protein [Alphaproteobacteria bacterium]
MKSISRICLGIAAMALASACSGGDERVVDPQPIAAQTTGPAGGDGLLNNLFGNKSSGLDEGRAGVAVNAYLWRAALDTVSFMPISTADVFAGVIITDWYSPPETPQERFKLMVYILDRELRADGLRVQTFRQRKATDGEWAQAVVDKQTNTDLENAILKRARQMRVKVAQ